MYAFRITDHEDVQIYRQNNNSEILVFTTSSRAWGRVGNLVATKCPLCWCTYWYEIFRAVMRVDQS